MVALLDKKPSVRISGYLEKKGKMRVLVSRWKRWWFVLEGRLLLYYKSQIEYLNLSPCHGSLNMGLAASVQPGKGLELTVVTRSQSVTLRASNRAEHEQWLQSLLDAMAIPHSVNNISSRPVIHFRYARQENHEHIMKKVKNSRCPTTATANNDIDTSTLGSGDISFSSSHASGMNQTRSEKCLLRRVFSDSRTLLQRPHKRNSVRRSKIAFSDTSIPVSAEKCVSKIECSEKCHSMQELRDSVCVHEDVTHVEVVNEAKELVLSTSKESKLSNSIKIELNLEDVGTKQNDTVTEQKIGNIKITFDGCTIYGSTKHNGVVNSKGKNKNSSNNSCVTLNRKLSSRLSSSFEAKSDGNLAVVRRMEIQSVNCENTQALDRSIGSTYQDTSAKIEAKKCQKTNKKRSHSILSRFLDVRADEENGNFDRTGTISKKLSFLRKMWKKREKKPEEDTLSNSSNEYESIPVITELSSPEAEKAEELLMSLGGQTEVCGPEPEPPPDYDISLSEEHDIPPMLPPRQRQRPPSPCHDVPKNNKPVMPIEDVPPPLPLKKKQKVLITISQDSSTIEHKDISSSNSNELQNCKLPSSDGVKKLDNLDALLNQLKDVHSLVTQEIDTSQSCIIDATQKSKLDPDYDVPRPHISLLATLNTQSICLDTLTATHFLCTTPLVDLDSLDPITSRLDAEMTPDSLECDSPWSLTHATLPSDSSHSDSMLHHFFPSDDKLFPDSLNS